MTQGYVNFLRHGIKNVHKSLVNRETTVTKLCNDSLKYIDQVKHLNPFITICKEEALDLAAKLDSGNNESQIKHNLLYGIPVSIKDNFCLQQTLTTCGSKMLHNYIPPYTATAVNKLLKANSIIMGKTNMDEFAMGSSSTTSYFGPTANSWANKMSKNEKPNLSNSQGWHMAGGSSTGSATSISSGCCLASLATDTGGSARQPASLTGIVGFKPSYGLISRFGLIPLAHCLDVVSIMAKNIDDVGFIFNEIVGQDENDLTTVDHKKVLKNEQKSKKTIRIGIPEEFIAKGDMSEDVAKQFDKILALFQSNHLQNTDNIELVKLKLPNSSLATECYTIISSAEISSNMSCYDGIKYGYSIKVDESKKFDRNEYYKANRDESLGPEVKKRILLGNFFLLEENREKYFVQALKVRRLISSEFDEAFNEQKVDIIMMPSTPTTSLSYNDWLKKQDNNRLFHEDYFLIPANLANLPSLSLPAGLSDQGLPIGLQLIANRYYDLDLLAIAKMIQEKLFTNIF